MKALVTAAAAAAMLLATPIAFADNADAGHRHRGYYGHTGFYFHHHRPHYRKYVRHRHHRWVRRGGVVVKIIVVPGSPYYHGCGGYCW